MPEPSGWTRVPNDLLRAAGIPHRELRVLLLLLSHQNRTTGQCNPSQALLAREAGISERKVREAVAWLRDHGLVDVKRAGRGSNWYFPAAALPDGFGLSDRTDSAGREGPDSACEPEEGNQMNEPDPAGDALPGVDWPEPAKREPRADDLTRAWCRGWSEARGGEQPRKSVVVRVGRKAKEVAQHLRTRDEWVDAWEAAGAAGRRGYVDLVLFMADLQPRQQQHGSVGLFTSLAMQPDEPAGWQEYDPPEIEGAP